MKFRFLLLLLVMLLVSLSLVAAQDESELLPYQNPELSVDERVEDLLGRMSLEEKIGQMTLIEKNSINPDDVTEYYIGGILSGGGGYPTGNNSPEGWLEMVHGYQDAALATPLGIPMIYGVDAVHGHSNLSGAVIFPHNIGLGAANNPELVEEIGRITATEMIATGIYWNYAPVLAVPRDIRWGRTYEGYSEDPAIVTELSTAMLIGLQGDDLSAPDTVLATPKHFVGDGGTAYGTSPQDGGLLDRGVTDISEEELREVHLAPYPASINNGARSVMISYSSWGGEQMHGQAYLINEVLIGELGFQGFIVSDWGGIDNVARTYYDSVVQSVNAGIDMNMVPYDYRTFIRTVSQAVENGDISMERIDQAVGNILRVKFEMGLFERPYGDETLIERIGSEEHRAVAREAVSQSVVLLKNENDALPLTGDAEQTVLVAGQAADSVGIQSGGWTIEWQGSTANLTAGTTILDGLQAGFGEDTTVRYSRLGRFSTDDGSPARGDIGIVVVGEPPYAEWFGDSASLELPRRDRDLIESMREQVDTLIVVMLSGRPMIVDQYLNLADAFVAAWLPGTEGDGVTDVLFGERDFVGKLSFTWPRNVEQLPFDFGNIPMEGCEAPLFPFGYGLTYESSAAESADWLALAAECAPEEVEVSTVAVAIPDADLLAPEGDFGLTYNAPFPVAIALDGQFEDWAGVPLMTMPQGADLASGNPAITFGAAADDTTLYLYGNIIDANIISGEHGENFWNEDSVEFYINATGDMELTTYQDGVAQLTIPALNITNPDPPVLAGVRGSTMNAEVIAVATETGWAVEVAIPLVNDVWTIEPVQGGVLGFQVHLNAASDLNRDTKLIWSLADTSDASYQNPSLFGELVFYEVGGAADGEQAEGEDPPAEPEATDSAESREATIDVNENALDPAIESAEATIALDGDTREWALVWNDEFEGSSIDLTKWAYDTGGDGFGNNELQYYSNRPENSYIEDGSLVIRAQEERFRFRDYTSAKLWTVASMNVRYGRIDIRARLPYGQGIWPAFWMLPAQYRYGGWPASGEIDIMEMVGHMPATVHGTLHYTGETFGSHEYTGDSYTLEEGIFADNYHVFSLVWEEDRFEWYVDGELYQVQTDWQTSGHEYPAPFDHEFFLILNLAVGGEWPGSPDETTVFPQTLAVDYVRVYQEQPAAAAVAPATSTAAPVEISVSMEPQHTISPYVYGVNHGPWALIPADFIDDVETLGATFIRFPGGNWGDDHQIRSYQLDDVMFWAGRMGADVSVTVNLREGTPEEAAALVEYANIEKEYGIRYWAIGNEPNLFGDEWDTARYNTEWRRFAEAMLAVDPTILFIGPDISQYRGDPTLDPVDENGVPWLESFLEANGDLVEIVAVHRYPFPSFGDPLTTVDELRSSTLEWRTIIPQLRETIRTITGDEKRVAVTEINSHWNDALGGEATPDSHFNAIWWADVLGQLIAHDTDLVAYFSLQSNASIGGYGLYALFDVRPTYYVYKLYQHFGQDFLQADTSHDFVNAYAALRDDGRIALILVNLTDEAHAATLNLAGEAEMMALTPDAVPEAFTPVALDGQLELPAQSVTLLLVTPQG